MMPSYDDKEYSLSSRLSFKLFFDEQALFFNLP